MVALSGGALGRLLNVLGQVIIARAFGAYGLGLFGLGWTVFRIGGLLAPLGLQNGVLRFGSPLWPKEKDRIGRLVSRAAAAAAASGSAAAILLAAAAGFLADRVFHMPPLAPLLLIFALALPARAALTVAATATRITLRMRYAVWTEELGQPAIFLCGVLGVVVWGGGLLELGWAVLLSYAVALVSALALVRRIFPSGGGSGSPISIDRLLRYSAPTALAGILVVLLPLTDRIFVGVFRSAHDVGLYQAASQVSLAFGIVLAALNAVFAPMISGLLERGQRGRLEALFRTGTRWVAFGILPLLAACTVIPTDLLMAVFGGGFAPAAPALVVLAVGQALNAITGPVGYLLLMSGRERTWLRLAAAALGANLAFNTLLVPRFGIEGAAWATAISVTALFFGGLAAVRGEMRLWPYDRRFWKPVGTAAVVIASAAMLRRLDLPFAWLTVVLVLSVGALIVIVSWLWIAPAPEDVAMWKAVRGRLGGGRSG